MQYASTAVRSASTNSTPARYRGATLGGISNDVHATAALNVTTPTSSLSVIGIIWFGLSATDEMICAPIVDRSTSVACFPSAGASALDAILTRGARRVPR